MILPPTLFVCLFLSFFPYLERLSVTDSTEMPVAQFKILQGGLISLWLLKKQTTVLKKCIYSVFKVVVNY
jgi:hypothetical protein